MNYEKLKQLNKMVDKIKTKKAVLETIDALYKEKYIVVTDYDSGSVELPEELRDVFFTLLKDYHQEQLDNLEKEFEEM
jgi:hypothetical protein